MVRSQSQFEPDQRKTLQGSAEPTRATAKRLGVPADAIVEIGQEFGPYAAMLGTLRDTDRPPVVT